MRVLCRFLGVAAAIYAEIACPPTARGGRPADATSQSFSDLCGRGTCSSDFLAALRASPPPCKDPGFRRRAPPTRTGVCLAGAIRSFNAPIVFNQLKRHLLEGVAARSSDSAELFLYLSARTATVHGRARVDTPVEASPAALAALAPTFLAYEEEAAAEQCAFNRTESGDGYARAAAQGLANILRQDRACADLIESRERAAGENFTHVLRSRPDALWYLPAPPACTWPANGWRFHDWAFLLPRRALDSVLRAPSRAFVRPASVFRMRHFWQFARSSVASAPRPQVARLPVSADARRRPRTPVCPPAPPAQAAACEETPGAAPFSGTEKSRFHWMAAAEPKARALPLYVVRASSSQSGRLEMNDYAGQACAARWGCETCAGFLPASSTAR